MVFYMGSIDFALHRAFADIERMAIHMHPGAYSVMFSPEVLPYLRGKIHGFGLRTSPIRIEMLPVSNVAIVRLEP